MFEVCFSHLIFNRDEYEKFMGFFDGFTYDKRKFYEDLDEARRAANDYRNYGHDQFLKGDKLIDVYLADLYDDDGDIIYE